MFPRTAKTMLTAIMLTSILGYSAAHAAPVYLSCYTVDSSQERKEFTVTWASEQEHVTHTNTSGKGFTFKAPAFVTPEALSYQHVLTIAGFVVTDQYHLDRRTLAIRSTWSIKDGKPLQKEGQCTLLPTPKTQF